MLDYDAFPHVIERIVCYSDTRTLLSLRGVSEHFKTLATNLLLEHVTLTDEYIYFQPRAAGLRIPWTHASWVTMELQKVKAVDSDMEAEWAEDEGDNLVPLNHEGDLPYAFGNLFLVLPRTIEHHVLTGSNGYCSDDDDDEPCCAVPDLYQLNGRLSSTDVLRTRKSPFLDAPHLVCFCELETEGEGEDGVTATQPTNVKWQKSWGDLDIGTTRLQSTVTNFVYDNNPLTPWAKPFFPNIYIPDVMDEVTVMITRGPSRTYARAATLAPRQMPFLVMLATQVPLRRELAVKGTFVGYETWDLKWLYGDKQIPNFDPGVPTSTHIVNQMTALLYWAYKHEREDVVNRGLYYPALMTTWRFITFDEYCTEIGEAAFELQVKW
ncbi:uncharacterized protein EHS24_000554 [Apiotrichum porosum]|uniref:F-box domain-containing protein n=1 Tax=Apiotrichum porosum TaxID=105984 RepID=A0A427YA45_9TREE|nr:uncharacterized protein EHS24_000554 [Apiotrichum porosum]RSH88030.1 hypothetical protein EHS24_000554 [Apiotrichum porosum]